MRRYDLQEIPAQDLIAASGLKLPTDTLADAYIDLNPFYFTGRMPKIDTLTISSDPDHGVCGGYCRGMVGSLFVFEQAGINYVVSLKDWISYACSIYPDKILHTYSSDPIQMTLL